MKSDICISLCWGWGWRSLLPPPSASLRLVSDPFLLYNFYLLAKDVSQPSPPGSCFIFISLFAAAPGSRGVARPRSAERSLFNELEYLIHAKLSFYGYFSGLLIMRSIGGAIRSP